MRHAIAALTVGAIMVVAVGAAEKLDIAALDQKTLPSEVYGRLAPGQRASLLWRDAGFALNAPYEIEKVEWLAPDRNSALLEALSRDLRALEQRGTAQYRVQARVTRYVPAQIKTFGKNVQPLFIVEMAIVDKAGQLVAAMVTGEKGDLGRRPKADTETFNGMVDRVIAAFDSEVMKGR